MVLPLRKRRRGSECPARLGLCLATTGLAVLACDSPTEPRPAAAAPATLAPAATLAGDHLPTGRVRVSPARAAFFRRSGDAVQRFAFAAQLLDSSGVAVALPGPMAWTIAGDGGSRLAGQGLSADRLAATAETESVVKGRDTLTARHGSASGRATVTNWDWLESRWQGRDWVRAGGSSCIVVAVADRAGTAVPLSVFHDLHGASLAPETAELDSISLVAGADSARLCVRGRQPGSAGLAVSAWDTTTFRYAGSWRRHHVLAEPLTLRFAADEWELGVGQEEPLALQTRGSQGNAGTAPASEASVSSSRKAVAEIAEAGGTVVRGVASGSATLSASYAGLEAQAHMEVHEIVAVRTGGGVTCVLLRRGTLRCTGEEGRLLGYGRERTEGVLLFPDAPDIPMGESPLVDLGRGMASYFACAVHANADIHCWGAGRRGQLGYGDGRNVGRFETPAEKGPVPVGGRVRSVGVAGDHACAVMEGSGAVRCWGDNTAGQLGYGSLEPAVGDDETPASFGDVPLGGRAIQVAGGRLHTCALMENGRVRCWGLAGENWDLANGKLIGRSYGLGYGDRFPHDEALGDDETPASVGDLPLPGRAVKISVGGYHTCALMAQGTVRCWGSAWWGVLGDGERGAQLDHVYDAANSPELGFESPVVDLASHYFHNCALLANGSVRCWGGGDQGALGLGHERNIGDDEPATSAPPVPLGGPATALAVFYKGGCAVMRAGGLRCWGNPRGLGFTGVQLGDDEAPAEGGDVRVFAGPLRRESGSLQASRLLVATAGEATLTTVLFRDHGPLVRRQLDLGLRRGPLFGPEGVLSADSLPPSSSWVRAK